MPAQSTRAVVQITDEQSLVVRRGKLDAILAGTSTKVVDTDLGRVELSTVSNQFLLTLFAHQGEVRFLLYENGKSYIADIDRRGQYHVDAILDAVQKTIREQKK